MRLPVRARGLMLRLGGVMSILAVAAAVQVNSGGLALASASGGSAWGGGGPKGELDCNGYSTVQTAVKISLPCADPHGANGARFYDNGYYVGHDEPNLRFISTAYGSGSEVSWTETLPKDPTQLPTVKKPGNDITHFFQLSVAPWFSMALCDPHSYPQLPCTPSDNANAPTSTFAGGGSAFMELQFYPPGFAPFADSVSCNIPGSTNPAYQGNQDWCAALTIDSLECTNHFAYCNPKCEEPVNFAFIQRNGVPTGPPSPQNASLASFTPNAQTLFFGQGDRIQTTLFDNRSVGAFEAVVKDLTTGQSGYMVASAQNGFMNTNDGTCAGTPYSFQPEYSSASYQNIVPWAALATDISTTFEIGHFTPCSSLLNPVNGTTQYGECAGPYESSTAADGTNVPGTTSPAEASPNGDGPCFAAGDTHGGLASGGEVTAPNEVTGCLNFNDGGDLDYDGSAYWQDWPNSLVANRHPSTMVIQPPSYMANGHSSGYQAIQFQTDNPASDYRCNVATGSGCTVPPPSPGSFYPYWTQVTKGAAACDWEFGNMSNGNTFGGSAQYGTAGNAGNQYFGTQASNPIPIGSNGCAAT